MRPSQPSFLARSWRAWPSPATCSLIRMAGDFDFASSRSRRARRSMSGRPRRSSVAFAQQIERDERHRLFAVDARDVVGVAQVNPTLQPLKSHRPPVAIEGDDLAIDDERFARGGAERRERFDDGWKLRRLVVAEPRPDAHRGGLARGRGFDSRQSARMPSYLGSKTSEAPVSGGSASVASIGRALPGFSRQFTNS